MNLWAIYEAVMVNKWVLIKIYSSCYKKFRLVYIYIYIELNHTQKKLLLGTAVSAFTTRPQPRF